MDVMINVNQELQVFLFQRQKKLELQKVVGIVVGEKPYGESSKILDILTKKYGVIGVLSKGSKKLKG